jgi:hypothetical protein
MVNDERVNPTLRIDRLDAETIVVPLLGTSPLIVHRWSEKAKREMLESFQGKKKVKQAKDPVADYLSSMYRIANEDGTEGHGFPVLAFKSATIKACRYYDKSISMALLRQCIFTRGIITKADPQQLVRLTGEPHMREDVVSVGMSKDLRYRAEYEEWSTSLTVTYVRSVISRESVLSLIDAGGMGVGVGEWRPEKSGEYGTYTIDQDRAIEVVNG